MNRTPLNPSVPPHRRAPDSLNPLSVLASAPCRVDLAGGTLDIWPLGLLQEQALTVNFALDLRMAVKVCSGPDYRVIHPDGETCAPTAAGLLEFPDSALAGLVARSLDSEPVWMEISSASPRGAGLGASSALAVALLAAVERLAGGSSSDERKVAVARDLEAQLMGFPTGIQDHWPGIRGGCLAIHSLPGGALVEELEVDLEGLGEGLVVAFTGESHVSADTNWHIVRSHLDGDPAVRGLFEGIGRIAASMKSALLLGDWREVGVLMSAEWNLRRQLSSVASTPTIEGLLGAAMNAGGWGGKACGAGGGGCVAIVGPSDRRSEIVATLKERGAAVLEARPTRRGLSVTVN